MIKGEVIDAIYEGIASHLKSKDECYFYWGIFNSNIIKYFMETKSFSNFSISKLVNEIQVDIIKTIPVIRFDNKNPIHRKIVELSKKILSLNKNGQEKINNLENDLNKLIYFLYGVNLNFERYLIEDFIKNQKDGDKTVDEKDLEDYIKTYKEEFEKSMLGNLMKNKKMLNNSFNLYKGKTGLGISYVVIDFNGRLVDDEEIRNNIKKFIIDRLFSKEVEVLGYVRYYDEKNNILYYFKPSLKRYWRKSEAIKDVLMENKIVLGENKGFLNLEVNFKCSIDQVELIYNQIRNKYMRILHNKYEINI